MLYSDYRMKNKQFNELAVCGLEAVLAISEKNPGKIRRLYFTKDKAKVLGNTCRKLAAIHGIYNMVDTPEELVKLSGTLHHQGVVAMIKQEEIPLVNKEYIEEITNNPRLILVLDRIGNANNFGAIVRSAAFFGIKDIIISQEESQSTISTSTYRIAKGGMEYVSIKSVFSIPWFLEQTGKKLPVIGTDLQGKDSPDLMKKVISRLKGGIIVLGNEENGISQDVRSNCSLLVKIQGTPNMESLNVAQAASILMYILTN